MKPKKCKSCGNVYQPTKPLQQVCSPKCAYKLTSERRKKQAKKAWQIKKKAMTEELMTHKDWVQKLIPVFNKYIRLRDANKGCISCGKPLTEKYDAGHCFPAGHYANLRFNEDNVHGQCVECNQHLHGNQAEYLLRLPDRIGEASYERLLQARNQSTKHSIPELREMIERYKEKIKLFNKGLDNRKD